MNKKPGELKGFPMLSYYSNSSKSGKKWWSGKNAIELQTAFIYRNLITGGKALVIDEVMDKKALEILRETSTMAWWNLLYVRDFNPNGYIVWETLKKK